MYSIAHHTTSLVLLHINYLSHMYKQGWTTITFEKIYIRKVKNSYLISFLRDYCVQFSHMHKLVIPSFWNVSSLKSCSPSLKWCITLTSPSLTVHPNGSTENLVSVSGCIPVKIKGMYCLYRLWKRAFTLKKYVRSCCLWSPCFIYDSWCWCKVDSATSQRMVVFHRKNSQ